MSEFLQSFLREESPGTPKLFVAGFGKHPGWNDHLDDFGLETESLVLAKRQIYTQGLASQIDSGTWDQLPLDKQLPEFNHLLLWVRRSGLIAGSMWSSQDGKGRAKYPMVLCVQGVGTPAGWAIEHIFPALEEMKRSCRTTPSASEVIKTLSAGRDRLRQELTHPGRKSSAVSLSMELATDRTGLHRVLYEIASQMRTMAPGASDTRNPVGPVSRRLRVPASPANARALAAWTRLISSQLDPETPVLGIAASDRRWIDFIIGPPIPEDFFCIRAAETRVPLTTEIPYTLEPGFVTIADQIIDDLAAERDSRRTIFGERPRGGFTLFPWATPAQETRAPLATTAATDKDRPSQPGRPHPLPAHGTPFWLKAVFILLGAAIIAATVYFATRHE